MPCRLHENLLLHEFLQRHEPQRQYLAAVGDLLLLLHLRSRLQPRHHRECAAPGPLVNLDGYHTTQLVYQSYFWLTCFFLFIKMPSDK